MTGRYKRTDESVPEGHGIDFHHIEIYEYDVPVDEYLETCVDVPQFLACCRQCINYDRIWSCPSFDFDPVDYFHQFSVLHITGYKIYVPGEERERIYSDQALKKMLGTVLDKPKKKMDRDMLDLEGQYPGSKALSGGSCLYCRPGECAKVSGQPCRFPEKMRYSIEALGGNVGLTVTKYLKQELRWIEKGRLPEYFILVAGLLIP